MRLLPVLLASAAAFAADSSALKQALTFHAAFDGGVDASYGKGDKRIRTAKSYKEQAAAQLGLHNPDVELAKGKGRYGDALLFKKKNEMAIFYPAQNNVQFTPGKWTGTISFWLSLDPNQDLAPGFCDPIQVTDDAYNDSAIWVDFTKDDNPRHFRLGVFGDLKSWNPSNGPTDKNPDFYNRLVVSKTPPFGRGKWTHVAVTHSGLGGGAGVAKFYLNGTLIGSATGIKESFTWDLSKAAIRLGLAYVGLFDDLAIFNRDLSDAEIKTLYGLRNGVAELTK